MDLRWKAYLKIMEVKAVWLFPYLKHQKLSLLRKCKLQSTTYFNLTLNLHIHEQILPKNVIYFNQWYDLCWIHKKCDIFQWRIRFMLKKAYIWTNSTIENIIYFNQGYDSYWIHRGTYYPNYFHFPRKMPPGSTFIKPWGPWGHLREIK